MEPQGRWGFHRLWSWSQVTHVSASSTRLHEVIGWNRCHVLWKKKTGGVGEAEWYICIYVPGLACPPPKVSSPPVDCGEVIHVYIHSWQELAIVPSPLPPCGLWWGYAYVHHHHHHTHEIGNSNSKWESNSNRNSNNFRDSNNNSNSNSTSSNHNNTENNSNNM